ncbi:MAG: peroxiredoxin family protein [Planctomycetota bacterium]
MTEQNKWTGIRAGVVAVIVLAAVLIVGGCKEKPAEPPNTEHQHVEQTPPEAPAQDTNKPPRPDTTVAIPPKPSIEDVIRRARTWGPAYTSWYRKTAPDFTVTDLTGKEHKLSDYRGKDVMLVFWATWCPPCKAEIPHLIVLRNTISRDKLAILAVSNERPDVVEEYVSNRNLNYT